MRKIVPALVVLGSLLGLQAGATWAAASKATVQLHTANMHLMAIEHAYGNATITYTKHDADIRLTVEKLPNPALLHASVYVLWLGNGTHRIKAGSFTVHNGMGGLHAMTMDTNFTKLIITAEKSSTEGFPMGTRVLSGAVMRH